MRAIQCPTCGAALRVSDTSNVVVCEHCGNSIDLRDEMAGGAQGQVESKVWLSQEWKHEDQGPHHSLKASYKAFAGYFSAELRDVKGDAEIQGPGVYMHIGSGQGAAPVGAEDREPGYGERATESVASPPQTWDASDIKSHPVPSGLARFFTTDRGRQVGALILLLLLVGAFLCLLSLIFPGLL